MLSLNLGGQQKPVSGLRRFSIGKISCKGGMGEGPQLDAIEEQYNLELKESPLKRDRGGKEK